MNCKAQFDVTRKSIYLVVAMFVIVLVILSFAFLIMGYTNRLTEVPPELKAKTIALRFINNADCFAYQDPVTGKVFSNSIDFAKFTSERLNSCYSTESEEGYHDINFKLILIKHQAQEITNNYFNVNSFTLKWPVFVYDQGIPAPDQLMINVQVKT